MNKNFVAILALSYLCSAFSNDIGQDDGGFVIKSNPGRHRVLVANMQNRVPHEALEVPVNYLLFRSTQPIFLERCSSKTSLPPDQDTFQNLNATIIVFVKDDPSVKESLTLAPDNHWACVNVSAVAKGTPSEKRLVGRVQKAVLRAICLSTGGGASQMSDTIVGPIVSAESYDELDIQQTPPDVYFFMERYLGTLGIHPIVRTTYEQACEEGWAPAPTNKIQKAIWDKVHAIPEKPLKITFDPATQKGKVTK